MKFKADQTAQKLRGGYYTPQNLADYITKWVCEINPKKILEPSCGDGVFVRSLHCNDFHKLTSLSCFELFDTEVEKTVLLGQQLNFKDITVQEGDFLVYANSKLKEGKQIYDGVIGNPPFIRYQFLDKSFQEQTELVFKNLGLKFTKHTNAWVPFVLSAIALLKDGGRLGMVIPSEIINVMHAQSLRTYLGKECSKIVIIDPKEIWFENTLQGAVILLAEKKKEESIKSEGVGIVSVEGYDFLKDNEKLFNETQTINGETITGKWTKAVLDKSECSLVNYFLEHENVYRFGDIADVDVGIVTGANDFFLVNDEIVKEFKLSDFAHPMFGRSQHCPGVIYDINQHDTNRLKELPTNFIYLKEDFENLPVEVQKYIRLGEFKKYQERYKCRIRKPWYKVPSVYSTRIGMLKRSHEYPKLILNKAEAYTTDTAYRIKSKKFDDSRLVYSFINPLTAISAELEGRSYGGGVLELVPSEIEKLSIPISDSVKIDIEQLDILIKNGNTDHIMALQSRIIFTDLGFKTSEINGLLRIWHKLKDRRNRK